ncbi:MAG: DASH family cryptochrome [Pseudomonadales bacterium]
MDDLRITDNPALRCWPQPAPADLRLLPTVGVVGSVGNKRLGNHRRKFLHRSLQRLAAEYHSIGQTLTVIEASSPEVVSQGGVEGLVTTLSNLVTDGGFAKVVRTRQHAEEEQRVWRLLQARHPNVAFVEVDGSTLFREEDSRFSEFPQSFSKFRRLMARQSYRPVTQHPGRLPGAPSDPLPLSDASEFTAAFEAAEDQVTGETVLADYFASDAASSYKETRNQFHGERFATGFSPWLAHGCISPLQVVDQLHNYEADRGRNESTEWIEFELLWREFFRWYGAFYQEKLFTPGGIQGKTSNTHFDPEVFSAWCNGTTQWPIVNACMRELNTTGWLSNRGRQLVASCLTNELGIDWRAGAGYFEQQLLDYDPCSNWGNWQYIAGVGADPRGGRHFNLDKQAEIWDPQGDYQKLWLDA